MKRIFAAILTALAGLCLAAMPALSEDRPVDPYRRETLALYEQYLEGPVMMNADSDLFTVTESGTFAFGETMSWTVNKLDGGTDYEYVLQLTCMEEEGVILSKRPADPDPATASFEPVAPGYYTMNIWARKKGSNERYMYIWNRYYTLEADGEHLLADEKADLIVDAMDQAGVRDEWTRALWLHDWLVRNADYDYSYSYYSPQGVLLRGTGVCDSFARAYLMLLSKAGISGQYISNENHAWVAVQLEGNWHLVDVTWDDGQESSDFKSHMYFCVTSELIETDHPLPHSPAVSCTSLACNYIVRTDVLAEMTGKLESGAGNLFAMKALAFSAKIAYIDDGESLWGGADVDYGLMPAAYLLDQKDWAAGGVPLEGKVTYALGTGRLTFRMTAQGTLPDPPASGLLVFPETVTSIGNYAYSGASSIRNVIVTQPHADIGYGAFYGITGLKAVLLPAAFDRELGAYAFPEGCAVLLPADYPYVSALSWLDTVYQAVE